MSEELHEGPDQTLRDLAEAHAVTVEYWDWQGRPVTVSAATVRAVLKGLGVDASTPEATHRSLVERELQTWRRMLPPTVVTRQGAECLMAIHVPHGDPVSVHVVLEDGSLRHDLAAVDVWVEPREVDGGLVGRATVALPNDLPMGWHAVHARSGDRTASSVLVVTPGRLDPPRAPAGSRSWGLMTQLYQVRSEDSWGIGDLTDLTQLAVWGAAELGADFVLVNPLHAAEPVAPITASPYLPTTRLYANPMYLRVEAIPEFAALSPESRAQVEALAEPVRRSLREDVLLDRDAAWTAKRLALDLVRSVPLTPERSADHARFRAREGVALQAFATWCALAETYGLDVAAWPEGLQHPEGELVEAAREEHQDLVDLQVWLQWVLEAQLTAAHEAALTAGMRVGVVHDLAVGVHPEGADAWALHGVLAGQCSVGAPPDPFNQRGQNWSQPPLHPERLAEAGYAPFRSLVRGVLRHAGGLRVDHVIGLFRMWWVPEGLAASEGTYVRYDHEALVGILALEAQRAGAVVIGEDLGVVEPWVRDYLSERGVLGTSISWFEKGWSGEPLAPEHWREACLGTVTTHDLPPTAGYLRGEHLEIREQLGLLTRPLEQERAEDERDREDVLAALRDAGLLDPDVTLQSVVTDDAVLADVVVALYAQLARTPCRLLGVALSDLVADRRAVNQPGTDLEYPNWRVPLTDGAGQPVVLDDLCLPGGGLLAHRLAAVLASRPAQ